MEAHPELRDWDTGLCDCFSDRETCVQGLLPCVLFEKNANKLGVLQDDNPCGEFCCMCTCAYGLCGMLGMCCAAVCAATSLFQVRETLRSKAGLKVAPCNDCCVVYCCGPCAACQEARVLKAMEASTVACTAPPTQLMGKDVEADPSLADLKPEVAMAQAVVVVPPGQQAVE